MYPIRVDDFLEGYGRGGRAAMQRFVFARRGEREKRGRLDVETVYLTCRVWMKITMSYNSGRKHCHSLVGGGQEESES
jgi:hypothetical protein